MIKLTWHLQASEMLFKMQRRLLTYSLWQDMSYALLSNQRLQVKQQIVQANQKTSDMAILWVVMTCKQLDRADKHTFHRVETSLYVRSAWHMFTRKKLTKFWVFKLKTSTFDRNSFLTQKAEFKKKQEEKDRQTRIDKLEASVIQQVYEEFSTGLPQSKRNIPVSSRNINDVVEVIDDIMRHKSNVATLKRSKPRETQMACHGRKIKNGFHGFRHRDNPWCNYATACAAIA